MSLLTVVQAVAEEVGIDEPGAVATSTDKNVLQLMRLANRSGRILAKRNWAVLQKEHTFTTVNGTASYSLPSDFERFLDGTMWDRDQYWSLRGPLSPKEWQVYKSGLVASATVRSRFRVKPDTRVNKYFLDPTPSSALDHVFEYASNQWVKDSGNTTGKTAYALDTDVSLIDEELIELDVLWRFLARKGMAYEEEYHEAMRQIDRAFAEDGGAAVLNMGGPLGIPESRMNLPEGNFTL